MEVSKLAPSNPSGTKILLKFVNLTGSPMDAISFQVKRSEYFVCLCV